MRHDRVERETAEQDGRPEVEQLDAPSALDVAQRQHGRRDRRER
jgi:hypothetical protein